MIIRHFVHHDKITVAKLSFCERGFGSHCDFGYRDSENPDTPDSITPETQTAVVKLKEELNIELKYDWIVNTDQLDAKFGAEMAQEIYRM